jgi:hypothetical protein
VSDQDGAASGPVLRVVSGSPTPEELAVLTAVVTASGGAGADGGTTAEPARGGWSDPARAHRRPLIPGPNGWRSAAW